MINSNREPMRNRRKNPVNKYMEKFNRPETFRDKKNDYKRKPKYPKRYDLEQE